MVFHTFASAYLSADPFYFAWMLQDVKNRTSTVQADLLAGHLFGMSLLWYVWFGAAPSMSQCVNSWINVHNGKERGYHTYFVKKTTHFVSRGVTTWREDEHYGTTFTNINISI